MIPENKDEKVIKDFGREWSQFDQTDASYEELHKVFCDYFKIFPWKNLPQSARGFDLGCGSGRWARFVSPHVGELHCIDPSAQALQVAMINLGELKNCKFHQAGVDSIPLEDNSMDFGYSLGVLHHVPDTAGGIQMCVNKLKPNAPFLIYLYYAFDNRPLWFKLIWRINDLIRRFLSRLPFPIKYPISQIIAFLVYLPCAKFAGIMERCGIRTGNFPLSAYKDKSFYTMRTDALDRFSTRLEQRFTKGQIKKMMSDSGLGSISFSENEPYWCAVGYKTKR